MRYPTIKVIAFFRRRYDLSSYRLKGASGCLVANGSSFGFVAFFNCVVTALGGF